MEFRSKKSCLGTKKMLCVCVNRSHLFRMAFDKKWSWFVNCGEFWLRLFNFQSAISDTKLVKMQVRRFKLCYKIGLSDFFCVSTTITPASRDWPFTLSRLNWSEGKGLRRGRGSELSVNLFILYFNLFKSKRKSL